MPLTPEQQVAAVMVKMGFITPTNINQSFQQPAPMLVESEPEISHEQRLATQKSISELVRLRGYRHPGDRA